MRTWVAPSTAEGMIATAPRNRPPSRVRRFGDAGEVVGGGRTGPHPRDGDAGAFEVGGDVHRVDGERGVEEGEAADQGEEHQGVEPGGAAVRVEIARHLDQPRALGEVGDGEGQEHHRGGEDDRHHAPRVELEGQIALARGQQVGSAHLALGADDGDAAASLLHEDDPNDRDEEDEHQHDDPAHGGPVAALGQLDRGAQGLGQGGDDVDEDHQGGPLADAPFGDHLADPHDHHRARDQGQAGLDDEQPAPAGPAGRTGAGSGRRRRSGGCPSPGPRSG